MWQVAQSAYVLDTPWLRIRRDEIVSPDGQTVPYYVTERSDIACILPVLADGRAILVRQYKHGVRQSTLEVPAGHVDEDETPAEAAVRELAEETGSPRPDRLVHLGTVDQDTSREATRVHAYLGLGVPRPSTPHLDRMEAHSGVAIELHPVSTLLDLIVESRVRAQSSVVTILLARAREPASLRFGDFGPGERLGVLVVGANAGVDRGDQAGD